MPKLPQIQIPTFNELLARVDDWPLMTGPQLAAAIGAAEGEGIFRQYFALVDDEMEATDLS